MQCAEVRQVYPELSISTKVIVPGIFSVGTPRKYLILDFPDRIAQMRYNLL